MFNVTGQRVEQLLDAHQAAGEYLMDWNPADLPSGIYFLRLQAAGRTATAKAVLVR